MNGGSIMSKRIVQSCLVVLAFLAAAPLLSDTAQAQKMNSRSVATPPPLAGGGGSPGGRGSGGGGGGYRGPGWGAVVPGIIMTVPQLMQPRGPVVYEDDYVDDQPRRRPPQRAARPGRPSGVPPA